MEKHTKKNGGDQPKGPTRPASEKHAPTGSTPATGRDERNPAKGSTIPSAQSGGPGLGDGTGKQGGATGGQVGHERTSSQPASHDHTPANTNDRAGEVEEEAGDGDPSEGDTSQNISQSGEGSAQRLKDRRKDLLH